MDEDAPALLSLLMVLVSCVVAIASVATAQETGNLMRIDVGKHIQVSSDHGDWTFGEGLAAADVVDRGHLIVCSIAKEPKIGAWRTVFYVSFDGGATWTSTLEDHANGFSGDPACGFGNDGSAYAVTLGLSSGPERTPEMRVFRSNDRGRTWNTPVVVSGDFDREQLAADQTTGPFHDRVYIDGMAPRIDAAGTTHGEHIGLKYSANGGKSFHKTIGVPLAGDEKFAGVAPGTMVVLSDGTVVIPYREHAPGKLVQLTTSTDGGEHLTIPVTIGESVACDGVGQSPQIAVDKTDGPFRERLYLVWSGKTAGRCQALLAYSSDRGKSWSKPTVVSDNAEGSEHDEWPNSILPAVAVNIRGIVGVSWYATAKDFHDGFALRFAASADGGDSFGASIPLSAVGYSPSRNTRAVVSLNVYRQSALRTDFQFLLGWPGDTQPLAADAAGVFHPFWYDNRTGVLQLWTAPVTVEGQAYRNGGAALAALDDVTDSVSLTYRDMHYVAQTHTVELDAVVTNTSSRPIFGPLKARVVNLVPPQGLLQVINAANGLKGVGAVWDWTSALPDSMLKPSQSSDLVKLILEVRGGAASIADLSNAKFDIRVLAHRRAWRAPLTSTAECGDSSVSRSRAMSTGSASGFPVSKTPIQSRLHSTPVGGSCGSCKRNERPATACERVRR